MSSRMAEASPIAGTTSERMADASPMASSSSVVSARPVLLSFQPRVSVVERVKAGHAFLFGVAPLDMHGAQVLVQDVRDPVIATSPSSADTCAAQAPVLAPVSEPLVLHPDSPPVFAEIEVTPVALARWLSVRVGPWYQKFAFSDGFIALVIVAVLLSTAHVAMDSSQVDASVRVYFLLPLWVCVSVLALPIIDATIASLLVREFPSIYLFANAVLWAVTSGIDDYEHGWHTRMATVAIDRVLFLLYMSYLIMWDAVMAPPFRRRVPRALVPLGIALGGLLKIVHDSRRSTVDAGLCLGYCVRVRSLSLSAMGSCVVFALKLLVSSLRSTKRATSVRLPLQRCIDRVARVQRFIAVVPAALGPRFSAQLPLDALGRGLVEVGRARLSPLVQSATLARIARSPLFGLQWLLAYITFQVAEVMGWTLQWPVAVVFAAIGLFSVCVDYARVDRVVLRMLLQQFEFQCMSWLALSRSCLRRTKMPLRS